VVEKVCACTLLSVVCVCGRGEAGGREMVECCYTLLHVKERVCVCAPKHGYTPRSHCIVCSIIGTIAKCLL